MNNELTLHFLPLTPATPQYKGGGQLGRMLLQAASPMAIPVVVLDPELTAPAKQASQPQVFPAFASTSAPLRHVDGAFTDAAKIRELAQQVDVLTVEIEHVNVAALKEVADECATTGGRSGKGIKVYPSPSIIGIIQDKYLQKVHLAKRGVPVAPFLPITADSSAVSSDDPLASLVPSVLEAGEKFGYPLMLKSRHLAYDGKGNFVLRSSSPSDVRAALEALVPASSLSSPSARPLTDRLYAEKFAPFVKEVAVMVARGASGETRAYPAVETIHRDSVCHIVYAPLRPPVDPKNGVGRKQRGQNAVVGKSVNERAQEDAQKAIDALGEGAVGVFGVEMFLMADGALVLLVCQRQEAHYAPQARSSSTRSRPDRTTRATTPSRLATSRNTSRTFTPSSPSLFLPSPSLLPPPPCSTSSGTPTRPRTTSFDLTVSSPRL